MNQFFLLKLIADLIKSDKPTIEEVRCARTIIQNLIDSSSPQYVDGVEELPINDGLDDEAKQARKELLS